MKIKFVNLRLHNFKSHRDLSIEFGDKIQITGENATGKSSIFESISWTLYGTDPLGSKLDPTPITYEADETFVSLLINVDGKEVLLGRELKKGKTKYFINEVPSKATEFNELLEKLFDKDLFLSLFNPSYFPSLHWEKQRSMLLKYVTAPANKEVLKELPEEQAKVLSELLKKHSLDDIEKVHKENKNKKDKAYIAAQSRTKTLKEQLEEQAPTVPLDSLNAELSALKKKRAEIEKITDATGETNARINVLQGQINALLRERDQLKEDFSIIKAEKIEDTCRVCKQPLQGDAVTAAEQEKQARMDRIKQQFDEVVAKRKELEAELQSLEYIDVSEQLSKVREIQEQIYQIEAEINKHKQFELLQKQVEQAQADEKETLESLNNSIFVLDSVKAFRAKEAEIQAGKVQELFDNLSIKLFEELKNGEIKPTFEIEMDGKPYRKLSLSEGIRAGLELRDVLSRQSGVITPVFVDNAESITSFKQPVGQLIISRVVAGQELKIESETSKSDEITVDIEVIE
ncbi:AAA family ATPase [Aeribacillus composti]|uniref:Nuclease SbcCD subunit C n=1 Tax=Aeribacillus composti TaxID=1868734 RepID=A0ABY9WE72_9BACI|nr:AAA family ATPase [Aeribacillus composti]WNF33809.1 AAA family ATPase [Aeribacillus composti]